MEERKIPENSRGSFCIGVGHRQTKKGEALQGRKISFISRTTKFNVYQALLEETELTIRKRTFSLDGEKNLEKGEKASLAFNYRSWRKACYRGSPSEKNQEKSFLFL